MSTEDTTPATNKRTGIVAVTPNSHILKGIPTSTKNTFSPSWSFSTTRKRDEAIKLRTAFGSLVNSGQIPFIEGTATKIDYDDRVRLKIDYIFMYNLDEYTIDENIRSILSTPDHALRIKRLYLNSGLRLEQIQQLLLAFRILRKKGVVALKSAYGDVTDIEYETDMNMEDDADAGDELLQEMSLGEILQAVTNRIKNISGAEAKAYNQEIQKLATAIRKLNVDGNGAGGGGGTGGAGGERKFSEDILVAGLQLKLRF